MPLANAVQYARKRAQVITWTDEDGNAIDLTGATLRGIKVAEDGTETSITGTLALVTAASGVFSWTYSEADVATPGDYMAQFVAVYGDHLPEISYRHSWRVFPSFNFALISPSISPSASVSPSASPSASLSPSASA